MAWQTIGLTEPLTEGPNVKEAQRELKNNPFGAFDPGKIDGQFGRLTAEAVKKAKYALGYLRITALFGPELHSYLTGEKKLPESLQKRRQARLKDAEGHPSIRKDMVKWCKWAIQHEPQIHYAQDRPIPVGLSPGHLPLTTDCSGSTILFARWAGVPAHPGIEYTGAGSSLDMGTRCKKIPQSAVQPGDLVVWPGHHVACVISTNPITLESHGLEGGPLSISLEQEATFHRGQGLGFYSLLESG